MVIRCRFNKSRAELEFTGQQLKSKNGGAPTNNPPRALAGAGFVFKNWQTMWYKQAPCRS